MRKIFLVGSIVASMFLAFGHDIEGSAGFKFGDKLDELDRGSIVTQYIDAIGCHCLVHLNGQPFGFTTANLFFGGEKRRLREIALMKELGRTDSQQDFLRIVKDVAAKYELKFRQLSPVRWSTLPYEFRPNEVVEISLQDQCIIMRIAARSFLDRESEDKPKTKRRGLSCLSEKKKSISGREVLASDLRIARKELIEEPALLAVSNQILRCDMSAVPNYPKGISLGGFCFGDRYNELGMNALDKWDPIFNVYYEDSEDQGRRDKGRFGIVSKYDWEKEGGGFVISNVIAVCDSSEKMIKHDEWANLSPLSGAIYFYSWRDVLESATISETQARTLIEGIAGRLEAQGCGVWQKRIFDKKGKRAILCAKMENDNFELNIYIREAKGTEAVHFHFSTCDGSCREQHVWIRTTLKSKQHDRLAVKEESMLRALLRKVSVPNVTDAQVLSRCEQFENERYVEADSDAAFKFANQPWVSISTNRADLLNLPNLHYGTFEFGGTNWVTLPKLVDDGVTWDAMINTHQFSVSNCFVNGFDGRVYMLGSRRSHRLYRVVLRREFKGVDRVKDCRDAIGKIIAYCDEANGRGLRDLLYHVEGVDIYPRTRTSARMSQNLFRRGKNPRRGRGGNPFAQQRRVPFIREDFENDALTNGVMRYATKTDNFLNIKIESKEWHSNKDNPVVQLEMSIISPDFERLAKCESTVTADEFVNLSDEILYENFLKQYILDRRKWDDMFADAAKNRVGRFDINSVIHEKLACCVDEFLTNYDGYCTMRILPERYTDDVSNSIAKAFHVFNFRSSSYEKGSWGGDAIAVGDIPYHLWISLKPGELDWDDRVSVDLSQVSRSGPKGWLATFSGQELARRIKSHNETNNSTNCRDLFVEKCKRYLLTQEILNGFPTDCPYGVFIDSMFGIPTAEKHCCEASVRGQWYGGRTSDIQLAGWRIGQNVSIGVNQHDLRNRDSFVMTNIILATAWHSFTNIDVTVSRDGKIVEMELWRDARLDENLEDSFKKLCMAWHRETDLNFHSLQGSYSDNGELCSFSLTKHLEDGMLKMEMYTGVGSGLHEPAGIIINLQCAGFSSSSPNRELWWKSRERQRRNDFHKLRKWAR